MFASIRNLPRTKDQWRKLAVGIHSDPASDFIRRKDAHRLGIMLDDFDHVDRDTIIDFRPSGPQAHGERDRLELRSIGRAMRLMQDDDDASGLQRAPIVLKEFEYKTMQRTNGTGPSALKRVMQKATDEFRDVVVVDTDGEPVAIAHRDEARMHHYAAVEKEWQASGPPFDPDVEIEIPRTVARDHQLYLREKERARRLGKEPRLINDSHLPPRLFVTPESVRSVEEIGRAHDRAKAIGADGYIELEPMPELPQVA